MNIEYDYLIIRWFMMIDGHIELSYTWLLHFYDITIWDDTVDGVSNIINTSFKYTCWYN